VDAQGNQLCDRVEIPVVVEHSSFVAMVAMRQSIIDLTVMP